MSNEEKVQFINLPSGEFVEILEKLPDGYKVRRWEFDEKNDAFPTQVVYTVPQSTIDGENTQPEVSHDVAEKRFQSNKSFVPFVYHKWFNNYSSWQEDLFQEGYLALWKACCKFKEDNAMIKFSTYAINSVYFRLLNYCRKFIIKTSNVVSLDAFCVSETPEGDSLYLIDVISDEQDLDTKYLIENCMNQLSDREQKIILDIMAGYGQEEIAKRRHISQSFVSRRLIKFRHLIEKEKNDND